MKPKDLIQGKKYIDRVYRDKVLTFIDFNDRDYGIYKDSTWIFQDFNGKEIILNARWIENLDEIEGKKTMPEPRKPEEIKLEVTNDEIIAALTSLGYDLSSYELSRNHSLPIFTLKLKKKTNNEKTKATD